MRTPKGYKQLVPSKGMMVAVLCGRSSMTEREGVRERVSEKLDALSYHNSVFVGSAFLIYLELDREKYWL